MPHESKHEWQRAHNLRFLTSIGLVKTPFPDWIVTVCYYACLHLIDTRLATLPSAGIKHPTCHFDRNKEVRHSLDPLYPGIFDKYTKLEILSRDARYECDAIGTNEVGRALCYYKEIEDMLGKSPKVAGAN